VFEQDLRAFLARAFGEAANQSGAVAIAVRCNDLGGNVPFFGDEDAWQGRGIHRPDRLLDELDAVVEQELIG